MHYTINLICKHIRYLTGFSITIKETWKMNKIRKYHIEEIFPGTKFSLIGIKQHNIQTFLPRKFTAIRYYKLQVSV